MTRGDAPIYAKTLADLRELSDEELIAQHDALAGTASYSVGPDYYLREITRRDADRQARTMLRLTWVVTGLTVANVVFVAIQVY